MKVSGAAEIELKPIIELRNISQSYDGGTTCIFENINLLIRDKPDQGEFAVILGASGCGKSTLLRYISGLQKPTAGEIYIHGVPLTDDTVISMVFQQYSSFPWYTVAQNVMLPLLLRGIPEGVALEKAMELIRLVGLTGHEGKYAKYPLLSGGQLQRVAIARSLITNPSIILMDEPFGALDSYTRLKMQIMLAEIWEKFQTTIIFVTHDIQEAVFLGDDIYVMRANPGMIVSEIPVGLPFKRDRSTKKEVRFIELVNYIEDLIHAVSNDAVTVDDLKN